MQTATAAIRSEAEEHRRVVFENPEQELRTLTFLNFHPNHSVVRTPSPPFVFEDNYVAVLEHLAGGDLLELVSRHKVFQEATARHFFIQIVNAVGYMHGLRVAHMDLSLENIGLSGDYRVAKLLDFGVAVSVAVNEGGVEERSHRGARGKLFYVAPEVRGGYHPVRPAPRSFVLVFSAGLCRTTFPSSGCGYVVVGYHVVHHAHWLYVAVLCNCLACQPAVSHPAALARVITPTCVVMSSLPVVLVCAAPPLAFGPCDKDPRFGYIKEGKIGTILRAWKMKDKVSPQALGSCEPVVCLAPKF